MRPHISYMICATHRTGSTLLCEALTNTGLAGHPEEFFWIDNELLWSERWGTSTYAEYLEKALEYTATPNGVFGCKIMMAYFDDFLGKVKQLPRCADLSTSALLSDIFPNLQYIWITRRDKVRQAVSLLKAVQTQIWEKRSEQPDCPIQEPVFDFEAIDNYYEDVFRQETVWQQYFTDWGVSPITVVYEDFIGAYQTTVLDILHYLNIHVPADLNFDKQQLKKQADVVSEEWVRRYYQLKEELPVYLHSNGEEK